MTSLQFEYLFGKSVKSANFDVTITCYILIKYYSSRSLNAQRQSQLQSARRALVAAAGTAETTTTTTTSASTSSNPLNNAELENITENITEFNNQLYQWRNRIEINPDAQVTVIRDTIDETRSMVSLLFLKYFLFYLTVL